MARIKATTRTQEFMAMKDEAAAMGESKDCAVKAVAIACNVDYKTAHTTLKAAGRKNNSGTYPSATLRAIRLLGFNPVRVSAHKFIERYPKAHQILQNVTSHHPERFNKVWADGETYVISTSAHVFTVVDGVNHDWTKGRALRATDIYRIEKIN